MESNIKLTIDGIDYEFAQFEQDTYDFKIPRLLFGGYEYVGKAILKEKDIPKQDWQILDFKSCVGEWGEDISSVKRSDGEIFSIGEITSVKNADGCFTFEISKFEVEPYSNLMVTMKGTLSRWNINLLIKQAKQKDIPKPPTPVHWEITSFNYFGEFVILMDWKKLMYEQPHYSNLSRTVSLTWLLAQQNATIHSVKDLVREITFTVGDTAEYALNGDWNKSKIGIIESFNLGLFGRTDKMEVIFEDNRGRNTHVYIENIRPETKPKINLFTTHDGCKVFPEDDYVKVDSDFGMTWYMASVNGKYPKEYTDTTFSTVEKANEYILCNASIEINYNELITLLDNTYNALSPVSDLREAIKEVFQKKLNP